MTAHSSPVPRFPGEVELPAALTFAQFGAWRDAVLDAQEKARAGDMLASDYALLPGIFAVVSAWRLEKMPQPLTPENFPASPRRASSAVIAWLVRIISDLVSEEETAPKV